MRKKNVVTPIPPCSQWLSDSGKLYVTTNKSIFNFTIVRIFLRAEVVSGVRFLAKKEPVKKSAVSVART